MPRTASVLLALPLIVSACGPDGRDDYTGDGGGSGSGSGSGSGNMDGCSDAAKLVYVVDSNRRFSRFDPTTKTFSDIGTLSCPASFLAEPFSMSVDRDAVAWVLYSSGELFRVDTTSLACTKSTWSPQQGLDVFGMGFSSNTAGSTDDTLFVAGGSNPSQTTSKLATLSTQTFTAAQVGTVTGWPELTGTGNAELWGWFPSPTAPRVEKINKTSGAGMQMFPLPSLAGDPMAWAFAFWGGDFWIFLQRANDAATTVYQIDGTAGTVKGSTPTGNRQIVGAGVSTCAPVVIL
jgi:hypothetical protein